MMWNDGWWGLGWGFHGLVPLLFIALVVWGLVSLARSGRRPAPAGAPPEDTAMAVLRERYARGDLDREQFETMRRDLEA